MTVRFLITAGAFAVLLAGCRRADPASTPSSTGSIVATPSVSQVSPNPIVIRQGQSTDVTVRGTGFDALTNTVVVGPITLTQIPSRSEGTVIVLSLPDRVPSGGGAAPMLWTPGEYTVTVSNARGTSAPFTIAVREPQ